MLTAQYNAGILKSRILLLLSYSIPEREGGGGAPTFFCVLARGARAEKSRAVAGDRPAGHCRAGI